MYVVTFRHIKEVGNKWQRVFKNVHGAPYITWTCCGSASMAGYLWPQKERSSRWDLKTSLAKAPSQGGGSSPSVSKVPWVHQDSHQLARQEVFSTSSLPGSRAAPLVLSERSFFLRPGWKPAGLSSQPLNFMKWLENSGVLMLFPEAGHLVLLYNGLLKKIQSAKKWPILL